MRYGQGALFSLPRPVRADALQVADFPARPPLNMTRQPARSQMMSTLAPDAFPPPLPAGCGEAEPLLAAMNTKMGAEVDAGPSR